MNVHMTYMEGPYKVYNNSTDVLEWCLKLNLYWSTGTCLWQSTRLKAMCPRWTLLAAAFHLECKYLQCVCVCLFAFIDPVVCHELNCQTTDYWFICLWPQIHGNAGHVSLTQSKHWEKHGNFQVYLSHPNKSSHRTFCLSFSRRLEVFSH